MDNYQNRYSSYSNPGGYTPGGPYRALSGNRTISLAVFSACILFLIVIIAEKSKFFMRVVPTIRGEVALSENFVITSIRQLYPIIVKKNDPFVGDQLRYSGNVKSLFAETAANLCKKGDNVAEVGAHYGFNAITIGTFLNNNGKYYAFEGNPIVSSYLRKNIVINDLEKTVHLINKAISDHRGTCVIDDVISYKKDEKTGKYLSTASISAECSTLDKEIPDENLSLLLIDVPGMEFAVIGGAREIISRSDDIRVLVSMDIEKSSKSYDVRRELMSLRDVGMKFSEVISEDEQKEITIDNLMSRKQLVVVIEKRNTL